MSSIFRGSSMVERAAVNGQVTGSNPVPGAIEDVAIYWITITYRLTEDLSAGGDRAS